MTGIYTCTNAVIRFSHLYICYYTSKYYYASKYYRQQQFIALQKKYNSLYSAGQHKCPQIEIFLTNQSLELL